MSYGIGPYIRFTTNRAVYLLRDSSQGETEIVWRDVDGKALAVLTVVGNLLLKGSLKTDQAVAFGVVDA